MNKKFLSAILFGALMATSAGTFVSCKDYDDDIKNLQTQIDTNKNAIAELQKLVGAGNWVTNVAASGESLVVTMSNGTSATIAGIKGADGKDGKNAAEWTIGEDGFWYVNGEKTANVAVAQNGKDGKDGVTAPSPKIENGVWVVYNWDAAKGEFVEEVTEISAAGTSAYVVLKDGAYILNIADENGEFVEVSLPATAESFTIDAIANKDVKVVYAYGEWKTPTNKTQKELFDKLAAKFPELKDKKDKEFVAQSGKLPFIVSPANVELTKDHSFALIDMKGKDAGATLSNPTKGMPDVTFVEKTATTDAYYESRAAVGTSVWNLDFVPALNKKGNGYVASTETYSLVVSGPKGVISSTPYVYQYLASKETDALDLPTTAVTKLYNEEGMDIFTALPNTTEVKYAYPVEAMKGMFILEATDPAQCERYDISIEGSVVTIGNMPKGQNIDAINLKLTAIAVNGSVDVATFTLGVNNVIAATGALADLDVTLAGNYKNGKFVDEFQEIWWSLDDLKLSALQMQSFAASATTKTLKVYTTDIAADGTTEVERAPINVTITKLYDAKKNELKVPAGKTEIDYTKVKYIKGILNVKDVKTLPGDYTVVLTAVNAGTTILKAESNLTLSNPENALVAIKPTYLDAEGVVIAATNGVELTAGSGNYAYQFGFDKIFTLTAGTTIAKYDDLDRQYDTDLTNWWTTGGGKKVIGTNKMMGKTNGEGEFVGTEVDKVHTFKATYYLFGNTANTQEIEFKVKWTSSIYAEDATDVITMTAAKLKIKFDDTTPTATDANKVKFPAITSAIWAQGSLKGQAYRLFKSATGQTTGGTNDAYDYRMTTNTALYTASTLTDAQVNATFSVKDGYLLGSNGLPVEIAKADLMKFGVSVATYTKLTDDDKFYLTVNGYTADRGTADTTDDIAIDGLFGMFKTWETYYYANGNLATGLTADNIDADHKDDVAMYNKYVVGKLFSIEPTTEGTDGTATYYNRAVEIHAVNFKLVNEDDQKFLSTTVDATKDYVDGLILTAKGSATIDKTALVEGKKVIPMEMIITDVWGKKMTYAFNVEISL